jgi:hypothetical protein|nr:MAG TPA: hypothetical protein [Microviridae sp.]
MDTSRFFLTHLNDDEFGLTQEKAVDTKQPILNSEIQEIIDIVAPVNPITGTRENDVSMLLSQNISSIEKQAILSRMQQVPPAQRHNLSDDDLLDMLPSRYNSTLVDADAVRQYFEENILPVSDSGEPVEPTEPTEPSPTE